MANGRGSRRRGHSSNAAMFQKNSIGVAFLGPDIEQINKALEKGIQEKVLRSAAHAGIDVFYKEIRLKVPFRTGQLYESIYQWHDSKQSTPTRQVYATGPNKKKAPHWHQVEHGNRNVAAHPFVRPAFLGKLQAANDAAKVRLSQRTIELIRELNR